MNHLIGLGQLGGDRLLDRHDAHARLGTGQHRGMRLGHGQDGGDDVGDLGGQQLIDAVEGGGYVVAVGEVLAPVAGAVHEGDHLAVGVLGVGPQVVATPGAGAAHDGDAVWSVGSHGSLLTYRSCVTAPSLAYEGWYDKGARP